VAWRKDNAWWVNEPKARELENRFWVELYYKDKFIVGIVLLNGQISQKK